MGGRDHRFSRGGHRAQCPHRSATRQSLVIFQILFHFSCSVIPNTSRQIRNSFFVFCFWQSTDLFRASQVALVVKNLPANAGDVRDVRSVLGSGRSPGGGHGNPLRYSCLENPMHRGVWRASVHGVTKSQTQVKRFSTHTQFSIQHIFIGLLHAGPCPGCIPLLRHSCFISTLFSPDFRSPFLDTLRSLCVSGNSDRCFLPGSGGHLAAAGRGGQPDLCHRLPFPWPCYNQGVCA